MSVSGGKRRVLEVYPLFIGFIKHNTARRPNRNPLLNDTKISS